MNVLSRAAIVYFGATLASAGCGPDETNTVETDETVETTGDIGGAVAPPYGLPSPPEEELPPEEEEAPREEPEPESLINDPFAED